MIANPGRTSIQRARIATRRKVLTAQFSWENAPLPDLELGQDTTHL
jgi:hypothetical protein